MPRALAIAALFASAPAFAVDISVPHSGARPKLLDLHLGFQPYYGLGAAIGGRFGAPIVENGFVPTINNAVYINFGVDFYTAYSRFLDRRGLGIGVPVTMQWNFYFTEEWSAFGEAGLNLYFGPRALAGDGVVFDGSWIVTSVGGRYHVSPDFALHLRVGVPYNSIGIEFAF